MQNIQKILGYMRKAIETFNMIEDNDKIAVALSGGKDSLTMLIGLHNLQRFYPKNFEIVGITVNPGFDFFDTSIIKKYCSELNITFIEELSDIKEIVFDIRKEKNPCSLCANLRRGILNSVALREGCNKISLGHNLDDVLETFIMNLFYAGSISTFSPINYMDRSKITLIRPLVLTPEQEIKKFIKKNNIEILPKLCPMDGKSNRENIKNLIKNMEFDVPHFKANLYGAIKRGNISGWK